MSLLVLSLLLYSGCLMTNEEYLAYRMALLDQDGDGYIWDHFPEEGGDDCDDFNALIHPGAQEVSYNGRDDDCDAGTVDDDLDDDGYLLEVDCNDLDAGINPGAPDVRDDGVDQDCDGADFSVSRTADAGASAEWGEPLPGPREAGPTGDTGPLDDGGTEGEGSEAWMERTRYSGRVVDESNLLADGDSVEIGIWRSIDVQGEPPFAVSPLASVEKDWGGEGVDFTLSFDLEAGVLETCEVYALTESAGYASSGAILVEAGDWVTDQTLSIGGDTPLCPGSTDNPTESAICGRIVDETGQLFSGTSVHLTVYDAEGATGEWDDLDDLTGLLAWSFVWGDSHADFEVNHSLEETKYVFIAVKSELEDGDIEADVLGRSDSFYWVSGTDVIDVIVPFTYIVP